MLLELKSFPIRSYKSINGWLTVSEAYHLYASARKLPTNSTIVEIGSWQGKSTYCLAKGLRSGKVYAIDPFDASGDQPSEYVYKLRSRGLDVLEQFKSNLLARNVMNKVEIKKGFSSDFVSDFNDIDFLFIDGDHSVAGCTFDFENFAPKVKLGGLIALHDYYPNRPELGPTHVIETLIKPSGQFATLGIYDSLWIGQRAKL